MNKNANGFTIVELLIVIVVIGILAVISIVAYNGISNSANDSAVKSDLSNFAKRVQMIHAEEGVYPSGGATIAVENGPVVNGRATIAPSRGLTFSVSKSAYFRPTQSGAADFMYCVGPEGFAVLARRGTLRMMAAGSPGFSSGIV